MKQIFQSVRRTIEKHAVFSPGFLTLRKPLFAIMLILLSSVACVGNVYGQTPTVSTDKATYTPGESIVVSFTNAAGDASDWISLANAGSANNQYVDLLYTDGTLNGTAGIVNGSVTFPNGLPSGNYEARLFFYDSFNLEASVSFTVEPAGAITVSTDKATYTPGESIVVSFTNAAGDASDWISLANAGSANNQYVDLLYTDGTLNGTAGIVNGSVTFPNGLPSGNYEARLFFYDSFNLEASVSFTVEPAGAITVSTDKATYTPGESIVVSFTNAAGDASDWISLANAGSANNQYVDLLYTDGTLNGTAGIVNGSVTFPNGLPSGSYEARLFFYDSFNLEASVSFTVEPAGAITVSTDKATYTPGESIVVSFTNAAGDASDWISLANAGSANNQYVDLLYTDGTLNGTAGIVNGSVTFPNGLPSGDYEARLFFYDSYNLEASASFDVATAPDAITDLSAVSGEGEVTLSWTEPPDNNSAITSYEVEYGTVASGLFDNTYTDDATPGATISGLTNGVAYQFRVLAINGEGTSPESNVVTATPAAMTGVTWTDLVGVSANGNTITKTAGGTGWNAGAASAETFNGDGGVDFSVSQANGAVMCGLSEENTDENYTTIDYALYADLSGNVRVYENGVSRGTFGAYEIGDRLRVARTGSTVTYEHNGTVIYTSTVSSSGPLVADASIYTADAEIVDAQLFGVTVGVPDTITDLEVRNNIVDVELAWTAPGNNGAAITEYEIQYGTVASGLFENTYVDDASAGATLSGLTLGVGYQFRVIAKNSYGSSGTSNVATGTPVTGIDVSWTDLVGVSANGNTITKTAGGTGWNAGAASAETFNGDGGVDFSVSQANGAVMCGLSEENTDENYTTIDYALYADLSGNVRVYENGVSRGTFGTYEIGDRLRVARTGSTVTYEHNGTVIYTSTVSSSGPLVADASIYTADAEIVDAQLFGVTVGVPDTITDLEVRNNIVDVELAWTAPGNNGAAITEYEIQYGTVASGLFENTYVDDASAGATLSGLTLGVGYQFRVIAKNSYGSSGTSNVATGTPVTGIDVSWTDLVGVSANGNTITKTAGGTGWNAGAASAETFNGDGGVDFSVSQANGAVMCGLSEENTDENYTTIDYALYADLSGNVRVYENGVSLGTFGTYEIGDRLRVARTGSTVTYEHNGTVIYTSTVSSSGPLVADASIYTADAEIVDAQLFGVTVGVPDTITDLEVRNNIVDVELAWTAPGNNGAAITEYEIQYGTVASGLFDNTYVDDASAGATLSGLTVGVEYQFRVIAKNSYGSSGTSNVATGTPVTGIDVIWTDLVGVSANGNTITKTAGGTGWNAGAASAETFNGDGGVDFSVSQANGAVMCGLSEENTDENYTTIDYALYADLSGNVRVYENGVSRGTFGTYEIGDRLRVARTGSTVTYEHNGTVIYTSTVSSSGPLVADASIYTADAEIVDAMIMGVSQAPEPITDLTAMAENGQISLFWTAPEDNGSPITEYEVRYGTVSGGVFDHTYTDDDTPGTVITGLTNDVEYMFRVFAINSAGSSADSNFVTISPIITFPVNWTDLVGVNANGSTITKTDTSAWGNGGAASTTTFEGDGGVEFRISQTPVNLICGLSDENTDADYTSIDYAIRLNDTGAIEVFENGLYVDSFGSYEAADVFRVRRTGNTITYQKNGTVFYTSTVSSLGLLLADAAIYASGDEIADANMIGVTPGVPGSIYDLSAVAGDEEVMLYWTAPVNNGAVITEYEIQYGTVASGLFDNTYTDDAVTGATITGLTNDTEYQFRVVAVNSYGTADPWGFVTSTPYESSVGIPVTWQNMIGCEATGNDLEKVTWAGFATASSVTTFSGDVKVAFTASSFPYGIQFGLSSDPDTSYTNIHHNIHINNPSGVDTINIRENGVIVYSETTSVSAGDVFAIERSGTTVTYLRNETVFYTSTSPSAGTQFIDVFMDTFGGRLEDAMIYGVTPGVPDPVTDLTADADPGEVVLDWTAPANNGTAIIQYEVQYGTVASGLFDHTYIDDDSPGTTISALTNGTAYQFRVVATNSSGSSEVSNAVVSTPYDGMPVTWQNLVNCTATGSDLENTSSEQGGASSVTTFSGDAKAEYTVSASPVGIHFGLSDSDPDVDWTNIDYDIYVGTGLTVTVYENGTSVHAGPVVNTGDVLSIDKTGSTITYLLNGTVFYTSAETANGTLLIDTFLENNGNLIEDARMIGLVTGVPGTITDLTAYSGLGEVTLYWTAPANNGSAIFEYEIQYGTVAGGLFDNTYTDDAETGAIVSGLTDATDYQFRVIAKNGYGSSDVSNTAAAMPNTSVDITWTDIVGVTVNGNTIIKNAATMAWDSGAASFEKISADGALEFTATQTNTRRLCGFSKANTDAGGSSIDYGIYLYDNGYAYVFENGANKASLGPYESGDRFAVRRTGYQMIYKKNGNVYYANSNTANSGELLADASIYTPEGEITEAKLLILSPGVPDAVEDLVAVGEDGQVALSWNAPDGNGSAITEYEVRYGTVASGLFDSTYLDDADPGAVISGLTNGVEYQFQVVATNGVGTGEVSNTATAIPVQTPEIDVVWTDLVGVSVDGNSITKTASTGWGNGGAASEQIITGDGGVKFTAAQTDKIVLCGLSETNADASIFSIEYAMYLHSSGNVYVYESGSYIDGYGSYSVGDTFSVERSGTTVVYKHNGTIIYTSTVPAAGSLLVDSTIYTQGGTISDAKITGIAVGPPDAVDDLIASAKDAGVILDWTAPSDNGYPISGYEVQYGTVAGGLFDNTYVDDDIPGTAISGLTNGEEYQFRVVAVNSQGTSDVSNVVMATPEPLVVVDVVWTDAIHVDVNGNTITNTWWQDGWESGAASMTIFDGDGAVDFTVAQTNARLACGLSDANTGTGYTSIDYAFYLETNGDLYIYENGVSQGVFGTYDVGDRLVIDRTFSTVTYWNDTTLLYTSTTPSTGPLMADSAIYTSGGVIDDARLSGISWSLPESVTDLDATPYSEEVDLSWSNTELVTGYKILYGTASGVYDTEINAGAVTDYTVTGLSNGTKYYFIVRGYNHVGDGADSNEIDTIPYQKTYINSDITEDTTWDLQGSPYIINTSIAVDAGVTLTIEPGVEVRFGGFYSLTINGTLNAQGTAGQRVLFTSDESPKEAQDWIGIYIYGNANISFAQFEYSLHGLYIDNVSPSIYDNVFKYNGSALYLVNGCSSDISGNTISNNHTGVFVSPSLTTPPNPTINNNDIFDNVYDFKTEAPGGLDYSSITINAENNWWGTTDQAAIENKIIHNPDDALLPVVDYEPYESQASGPGISNPNVSALLFTPVSGETTSINYTLDQDADVTIKIYLYETKELVYTLLDSAARTAGTHSETWDGRNNYNEVLPYDVYYYTISAVDSSDNYSEYDPQYVEGTVDFLNYSVEPDTFDPYQNEVVTVSYDLLSPSWVILTVNAPREIGEDAYEIDELVTSSPQDTTGNQEIWDGRDAGGFIRDGDFYIFGWATLLPDNAIALEPDFEITSLTTGPYSIFPIYGDITHITYEIPADAVITLEVLDPDGVSVRTLINDALTEAGHYTGLVWDGKDDTGRVVSPAGNYIVKLTAVNAADGETSIKYANVTIFD